MSGNALSLTFDPGPLARLEDVKRDPMSASIVCQRVCDGETLPQIAKAWAVPKGRFVEWFTTQHAELYDAALKVRADELAHEALECADGATPETVGVEKLRSDVRFKLASKWDRKRYGDESGVALGAPVTIQIANLRGAPMQIAVGAPLAVPEKSEAPI